jgi:hypothetical protein
MLFKNAVSTTVVIYLALDKGLGQMSFVLTYTLLGIKDIAPTETKGRS